MIPVTAGCGICATPTTTCSGSPDRRPRPSRSNNVWRCSCVMTSSWNCLQVKTLITHARSDAARFLGYEITIQSRQPATHQAAAVRSTVKPSCVFPKDVDQGQVRSLI